MREDGQQLKRDYRAIEAPPGFAARVQARLPRSSPQHDAWLPAAAAAALVVVAVLLLRPAEPPQTVVAGLGPAPSLTALSRVMADKPSLRSPSLTRLRSYTAPPLPPKPHAGPPADRAGPQRRSHLETTLEETQHG